ncbi:MAG: 6-bladed beta-propeller [bacterium]|nr:6-bladed beta-propeller [bacterium]
MKTTILIFAIILLTLPQFAVTRNADKPEKGTWDFQLKKEWESNGPADDIFGEVQNIETAEDGRVYVLDAKMFKINIFSRDGKYISSFGAKGEGPGEFRALQMGQQLFRVGDGIILTERGRIHYFSLDGKFIKTAIYPSRAKPRAFVSQEKFILAPTAVRRGENETAKVKLYDLATKTENVITEFKPFDKASDTKNDGGRRVTVRIIIGDITPLMLVAYRDNKFYYGMSDTYDIKISDLEGKELGGLSIPDRERVPVSKEYLKNMEKELGDVPKPMLKKILAGLPKKATFFQDMEVDEKGTLYVMLSDPNYTSGMKVDVFSPSGKYVYSGKLALGEGLELNVIYFKDGVFIAAAADEEGNEKVIRYSVSMPVL